MGSCHVLDPLCFYLLMMCQLFHTMGLLCAGPGAPAEAKAAETETGGASETLGWDKFWRCICGDLNCSSLISSLDLRFKNSWAVVTYWTPFAFTFSWCASCFIPWVCFVQDLEHPLKPRQQRQRLEELLKTLGWGKFWQCIRGDLNCWSLISSLDLRFKNSWAVVTYWTPFAFTFSWCASCFIPWVCFVQDLEHPLKPRQQRQRLEELLKRLVGTSSEGVFVGISTARLWFLHWI